MLLYDYIGNNLFNKIARSHKEKNLSWFFLFRSLFFSMIILRRRTESALIQSSNTKYIYFLFHMMYNTIYFPTMYVCILVVHDYVHNNVM